MICHECVMTGESVPAVGLCKFCLVGLCKLHLVELFRRPTTVPLCACRHTPAQYPVGGSWDERPWRARIPQ